jgi:hypothetical protein
MHRLICWLTAANAVHLFRDRAGRGGIADVRAFLE